MNTKHISLAFAAATALLAGCAKSPIEEVKTSEQFTDLELAYVGAIETKAAIDGTTFPTDGEIGLFLFADEQATKAYGDGYENIKYAYNSTKKKWTANPSIKVGSTPGYLYGYYPYKSGNTDIKEIPVASSLNGDDVMYATPVMDVTDATASQTAITMNHALARVSITIKNNGYTGDAKLSKIKISGAEIAPEGTLNALDGSISATKSEVTLDVTGNAQTITAAGSTYECLLVPSGKDESKQAVDLTLTIDDKDMTATLSGDNGVIIAQGTKSNITIGLSNSGISVAGVSIDDWKEVEVGGHKVTVKLDEEVSGIEKDVWVMAYAQDGNAVIEAYSKSGNPVKCVKDGERITGSKTGTLYKFIISDITGDATITIGYSKYTATIGFAQGSVTGKATLMINGDEVEAGRSISVFEGTNVEYSAEADGGYLVLGWYDNNGQKVSDAESFTVSGINSNVAYYAEVKAGCRLTVNTISAGSSTIAVNGVSIESGRAYYYDQNTQMTLTASPATECNFVKWCDADGKTLSTENPYSVTLTSDLTIFAVFEPEGALSGVFSVSGNKKVRFSKGNLWYGKVGDASEATFNFETKQYDDPLLTFGEEPDSHVGHFYWSKDATVARSLSNYTDSDASVMDVFFTNDSENQAKPNLGFTVNGQTGFWRVLSGGENGEWKYLINKDDECGTTVRSGKYKYGVTVCGKTNCLVLLPDDWKWDENTVGTDWQDGGYPETSTDKVTWQTMEKAGAVCLPAAGYRDGNSGCPSPADVNGVGFNGDYWSTSPNDFDNAYDLIFNGDGVNPSLSLNRSQASSVRLVTESK